MVEQADLARAAQRLDVVDGNEGHVCVQRAEVRVRCRIHIGVGTLGAASAQQVSLAGTGFTPQEQAGFAIFRRQPGGQRRQSVSIAAHREILQRRWVVGNEVEDQLAHDWTRRASEIGCR